MPVESNPRPFALPPNKIYHFFVCHHQGSGGEQAKILCLRLQELGFSVWYDNDKESNERNLSGMRVGVQQSMCVIVLLTGRMERKGQACHDDDPQGQ